MKKTILFTMVFAVLGLILSSCKTDISQPQISANPTVPNQSGVSLTVDFNKANAASPITFTWTAADFGFASSTTYNLQLSTTNNFTANVKNLATTQTLTYTSSVKEIDNVLLAWNLTAGTQATVYYRVAASVTDNNVVYSAVKSINLTPFKFQLDPDQYTVYYVPGSYQGWSPGAANGRIYSYNADSKFEGIVRLYDSTSTTAQFKITSAANWDNNWGGTLTKNGTDYTGNMVVNGDNYVVTNGCYSFTVDVTALTISLTKTHDWGIIGDFNGWSASVPMFYDGKYQVWTITGDFKAGGFKFRADSDWSLNYGDGGNGTLSSDNAPNISLPSDGNYTISFDPVKLTYTVKKN